MAIIKQDILKTPTEYSVWEGNECVFWTEDPQAAEKYCENYYGTDWGWQ